MAKPIPRAVTPLRPSASGVGVGSLFGKSNDFPHIVEIDIDRIQDNPHQARRFFDEQTIADLAASIDRVGLQVPIIVRKGDQDGSFILVAGERRLRAHRLLEKSRIFAIVTSRDTPEAISLIENVTRENLNIVELAHGLKALIDNGSHSQREAAGIVGLSENVVTRTLGVLGLPQDILDEYASVAEVVSGSTMMELTYVEDRDVLRSLWERAKQASSIVPTSERRRAGGRAGQSGQRMMGMEKGLKRSQ